MVKMSNNSEIYYLTIAELSRAYKKGCLSPLDVTKEYLRRIEILDDKLHSYTTVMSNYALEMAKKSEKRILRGEAIGPLDGIPLGLKDVFDTAGVRTTANSALFLNRIPDVDATVVKRLKLSGAVLLGKLATHEFSSGIPKDYGIFPAARNPWNTDHSPGGSSSGPAVAVSAGLCAGAFGGDTLGSIRAPASYCGIVGLKPSAGLVSRFGVIPLSWSLDQVGPMTRSVEDIAILLQTVAGYDPLDLSSVRKEIPSYTDGIKNGLTGLQIGSPLPFLETKINIHQETMKVYKEALRTLQELGAVIVEIDFPKIFEYATELSLIISTAEAFAYHEHYLNHQPEKYGSSFIDLPLQGALYTASDYIQALRGRTLICREMANFMKHFDLLALPTKSSPALKKSDVTGPSTWTNTTLLRRLFSMTGQPAITIPAGFSQNGLPIGLQLAARLFEENVLLTAAYAFEQATNLTFTHPPL
jgi:aspartyl-tRNA(Asn)/glutamyl-tRNA(Gln) amidotransferase subunit A